MNRRNLIILVGNIGVGKSTYSRKLADEGYIVISRDQLRYGIGGGTPIFDHYYESIIWKTEFYMFKQFANLGVNLVIDSVAVNKRLRARYIKYAKSKGYYITVKILPKISMNKSVNRRMKNPHGRKDRLVWERIWNKFDAMYEEPTKDEGMDEIIKS
jgi:predicted kinase